jgi:dCMP deaminase
MSEVTVAYIPVLHEGYRRFLQAHAAGRGLYLIGPELYSDYRPLAKDIRCLDAGLVAASIRAWGICSEVEVLDKQGAARLADEAPTLTLPDEDVSHQVVERWFSRCAVRYDSVFLRWDKTRSAQLRVPGDTPIAALPSDAESSREQQLAAAVPADVDETFAQLAAAAQARAAGSADWWRQVGAAIRFTDGRIASAVNEHSPHPLSPYAVGDPRANFSQGVHLELSTATHAEVRLIAEAARDGVSTKGAVMYVTDFPCPPCAKLIAAAGIDRLYFRAGYAVLDGEDVLAAAGVEVVQVA